MHETKPEVYLLAVTDLCGTGLGEYLDTIGASDWHSDADTGGEVLLEAAGRLCYRSWKPGLNKNVTRVRSGNKSYIGNLLKQRHTSVLEHVNMTFLFKDVSRVFCHELVRHRAGCAYSQESLRYVALDDLGFGVPDNCTEAGTGVRYGVVLGNGETMTLDEYLKRRVAEMEEWQNELSSLISADMPFSEKKRLTSLFRRIAPMGLSTSIVATFNLRALRHIIGMRTAPGAEAEIRAVFREVARIASTYYRNVFQDIYFREDGSVIFLHEEPSE